ncbi:hypothetical protein NDA01_21645 [Trichocoleus desertorum AS-A10]|uniref:hypothetical protein n=1 Tax=Trichocoleus desertorum TaxID=1481672 RepID=UPI0032995D5F
MGKPGKGKSQKGKPETDWAELKTSQLKAVVTPTAKQLFPEFLKKLGISFSEFIEYLARDYLQVKWRDFTIAELVGRCNLDELARESGIGHEELEAIAQGVEPSPDAINRLGGLLRLPDPNSKPLSAEELHQIHRKTSLPK